MVTENSMLQSENDRLRQRVKALSEAIESLKADNAQLVAEAAAVSLMGANGNFTLSIMNHLQFYQRVLPNFPCIQSIQKFLT